MRSSRAVFVLLCGVCLALLSETSLAQQSPDLLAKENLGGIKIGLSEKQLLSVLGKATVKKSAQTTLEEATGDYVQTWACADLGLTLRMSSGAKKTGAKSVASLTAVAPCKLRTARDIGIGSSREDVVKAYGAVEDKEASKQETFVAGSVYGGIIFSFKNGKVSQIFLGAAAE